MGYYMLFEIVDKKSEAHVDLQVKLADCVEREGLGEGAAP